MSRAIPLLLALGGLSLSLGCIQDPRPTVGVAASLRGVMPHVAEAYEKTTGDRPPAFSFGASGTLAKQLEAGAPLSGVVLASAVQIDDLIERALLDSDTRSELASNTLVLAGRHQQTYRALSELSEDDPAERIAIGDPRFVPAGAHAREALEKRGLWNEVTSRAIFTRDVTAAVALLRRGEVNRALVYATDVRRHPELTVLETIRTPQRPIVVSARARGAESVSAF